MHKHGHSPASGRSSTYKSWASMIQRCLNKNDSAFYLYGGRGVCVCRRWRKFSNFLADMGTRPEGKTLDRFPDKNGDYKPGNCRWATPTEQQHNKRDNRLVTFDGLTLPVKAWAKRLRIPESTLRHRLKRGWAPNLALTLTSQRGRRLPVGA
jgi:hypothetical protein